jgi:hypothetical protein
MYERFYRNVDQLAKENRSRLWLPACYPGSEIGRILLVKKEI